MIDLSNKCEHYLNASGHTIYSLAQLSGLERTDILRLIHGTCLPERSFLEKFCDALRMNINEKKHIFELYEKASSGSVVYYNRKYIGSIINHIIEQEHSSYTISNSSKPASFSFAACTEFQNQTFIQIYDLLENILCNTPDAAIYCNFPVYLPFSIFGIIQELHQRYPKHKPINFYHIFTFASNPSEQPDSNCNLKIVGEILPLIFSGFESYHPFYTYSHSYKSDFFLFPFPYYLIAGDMVLALSADGNKSILITEPEYVQRYLQEFQILLHNSRCLMSSSRTLVETLALYTTPRKTVASLTSQPSLIHCLASSANNAGLFHAFSPNETAELIQKIAKSPHCFPSAFSKSGFLHFWNTGEIVGQLASHLPPLTLEQRKMALSRFVKLNNGKHFHSQMLKNETKYSLHLYIELISDYQILICLFEKESRVRFLLLKENSIYEAFLDYLSYMRTPLNSFSLEETNEFILHLLS